MKAHLIDTHLLVPRSRSSAKVKVKYQGHVSQKMGVSGAFSVSQTHLVLKPNFVKVDTLKCHIICIYTSDPKKMKQNRY